MSDPRNNVGTSSMTRSAIERTAVTDPVVVVHPFAEMQRPETGPTMTAGGFVIPMNVRGAGAVNRSHYAYAAYLGMAAAIGALLAPQANRHRGRQMRRSPRRGSEVWRHCRPSRERPHWARLGCFCQGK
jgi:hypothetical protein